MMCVIGIVLQALGTGHHAGHPIVSPAEAAEHAAHCHGPKANCGANVASGADQAVTVRQWLLLPTEFRAQNNAQPSGHPADPSVPPPDKPPRAAPPETL